MIKKWLTLSKEQVFKNFVTTIFKANRKSITSNISGEFDILHCSDWVNIITITSEDEVVFVKQYRHGIDDITLETPAGGIEKNEDPKAAAIREMQEESGYTSDDIEFLGTLSVNPAMMTNKIHLYLARNAKLTHNQNLDPLEEIEVVKVALKDIPNMIFDNKLDHSLTALAFGLYSLRGYKFN